ncbi:MAG: hypothetical protein H6621_04805 [Halobacteriovoraceae bacterium]|nr:hypothetical protein [Halobacteriovoraceae bacterium]
MKILFLLAIVLLFSCKNELEISNETTNSIDLNDTEVLKPEFNSISDQSFNEGENFTLDLNDSNSGNDNDGNGNLITYSCVYDLVVDGSVSSTDDCEDIPGFSIDVSTGVISWNAQFNANESGDVSGNYELAITATSNIGSDQIIFVVNVVDKGPAGLAFGEEWIQVPANAGGLGLPSFWVMKYEAKAWNDVNSDSNIAISEVDSEGCDENPGCAGTSVNWGIADHRPVSTYFGKPWRRIRATNTVGECESIGAGYGLITNDEWMAIARDVENQAVNWTGNSVGSGCLFRGNSGEVTTGDGSNIVDSCGYDGADPEQGASRDIRAILTLSNGEQIYDFAGNIEEIVDWDNPLALNPGLDTGPVVCSGSELPAVACGSLVDADYNTGNGTYDRTNGVGYLSTGVNGGAGRGGYYLNGDIAGAFRLGLLYAGMSAPDYMGFRCVYRP